MFRAGRPSDNFTIEMCWLCPKCNMELEHEKVPGVIHIEGDYYIQVSIPENITVSQVKALRNVSSLGTIPAIAALNKLRSLNDYHMGPYGFKGEAMKIVESLGLVGLEANIYYKEPDDVAVFGIGIH